jgi:uncharacterized protein YyaL (SSP411 family)
MEHESFENESIAAILNKSFISIKVDREERPDIDRIYMAYVQAATGSGGWPMSVWLTPDGRPFVGGTYFPPDDRYGRPGFGNVLGRIAEAWTKDQDRIVESSARVLEDLQKQTHIAGAPDSPLDASVLDLGFTTWRRGFDTQLGGFGRAPKFPRPAVFDFLLRYGARTKNPEALEMVKQTLGAMSRGGMNDQLGGGFHRYSVDEYWFVPHFEKMLYDQAQIASSLIEVFQMTKEPEFAHEARRVLDYVLRDMTDPDGGFYSAEDADSAVDAEHPKQKGEGAFYIWTAVEIQAIAGEPAARYFNHRYGVGLNGNVDNDPHHEFSGRNILFEAYSIEETAHHFDRPIKEVKHAIEEVSAKLMAVRETRVRPHLDDKVLTSWNGLMISAFTRAGAVLDEARYSHAARRAAGFIRTRMWNPETRTLLRRYRQDDAAIPGFLDDYAFFTRALLDLYETQFDLGDLELAIQLTERQMELFEDQEHGAFFSSPDGNTELLIRMKDDYDGAEPSGNSIAALNLLRLHRITGRKDFLESAQRTLQAFAGKMTSQPFGVPLMMCALDLSLAPAQQIVLAGERGSPDTQAMLREISSRFQPHSVVLLADSRSRETLARWNEAVRGMQTINGKTAAYVCENFTCQLPVTEVAELVGLLQ